MKLLYVLLICLLSSLSKAQDCDDTEATKFSDCENLNLKLGDYRCCYVESKYTFLGMNYDEKECVGVTKEQYDDIDSYTRSSKNLLELMGKVEKYKVNCGSNYLFISLLLSLLFLL